MHYFVPRDNRTVFGSLPQSLQNLWSILRDRSSQMRSFREHFVTSPHILPEIDYSDNKQC